MEELKFSFTDENDILLVSLLDFLMKKVLNLEAV